MAGLLAEEMLHFGDDDLVTFAVNLCDKIVAGDSHSPSMMRDVTNFPSKLLLADTYR